MRVLINALLATLATACLAFMSLHVVGPRQAGMVVRLGQLHAVESTPGLYWQLPFVDGVHSVDLRQRSLEVAPGARLVTHDGQPVVAGMRLLWQVVEPRAYWQATGGDEARAEFLLQEMAHQHLSDAIHQTDMAALRSGQLDTRSLTAALAAQAKPAGIAILAVRISRLGLPTDVAQSVLDRMRAARNSEAADIRAKGQEQANGILAEANKKVEAIQQQADEQAQAIRAKSVAEANRIRAAAYSKNPALYRYWKSMEIYRQDLANRKNVLVLEPDSPFLQYLKPGGAQP